LKKPDRLLSCVFLILRKRRPTAFVRFLNLRKRRPTGVARGFLRLRKHRPTDPRAGVFLAEVPLYGSSPVGVALLHIHGFSWGLIDCFCSQTRILGRRGTTGAARHRCRSLGGGTMPPTTAAPLPARRRGVCNSLSPRGERGRARARRWRGKGASPLVGAA